MHRYDLWDSLKDVLIVGAVVLVVVLFFLNGGFAHESATRSTLIKAGYSNIEVTGWKPLTCGGDDFYSTGFTAKNPAGNLVSGVVCCGLIVKSCTVRF